MEMTNVNRDLEDYKLNELFELAAWLHGEEFPSPVIVQKKKLWWKCLQTSYQWRGKRSFGWWRPRKKKEFVYKCMNARGRTLPYWKIIRIGNY